MSRAGEFKRRRDPFGSAGDISIIGHLHRAEGAEGHGDDGGAYGEYGP